MIYMDVKWRVIDFLIIIFFVTFLHLMPYIVLSFIVINLKVDIQPPLL